jgi:shikimate dehydrogenase
MAAVYGLIGYPLTHSFSSQYFQRKFAGEGIDAQYRAFELTTILEFPALLESTPDLKGLNVTIPYKAAILPYLDRLSEAAMVIGAVNCIDIENNKLAGYNTDVIGFSESLKPLLKDPHTNALVLGTGGSSLAVKYVLEALDIEYVTVSRTKKAECITYKELTTSLIKAYPLIINTTPVGMYPNTESFPELPYEGITEHHLLFDLVYNPEETKFLSLGKERGATVKNGLEMLHLQAEASWRIWNKG